LPKIVTGDGSLGLVAGVAIERDVPFFCVPVGTRNHFALDLGLDRENPLTALDAIGNGEEVLVDYGLAGDRPFLNNVSFGIYAEAVHRDEYRENKEQTIVEVMREMRAGEDSGMAIRFTTPDGAQAERTAMTMVSNNPYVFSGTARSWSAPSSRQWDAGDQHGCGGHCGRRQDGCSGASLGGRSPPVGIRRADRRWARW
jgi:diacylglycerol kinase family enzyme